MKTTLKAALAGLLVSCSVAGTIIAVANESDAADVSATGTADMDKIAVTQNYSNVEGTRVLSVIFTPASTDDYIFQSYTEMDIDTIIVSNGSASRKTADRVKVLFRQAGNSPQIWVATNGWGAETISLRTPLKMREGATVQLFLADTELFGEIDVTMIGTAPTSNKMVIK